MSNAAAAISNGMGRLSGPAIRPIAVRMVVANAPKRVRIRGYRMAAFRASAGRSRVLIAGAAAVQGLAPPTSARCPCHLARLQAGIEDLHGAPTGIARVLTLVGHGSRVRR